MSHGIEFGEQGRYETIAGEARQVVWSPEQVALHLPVAGPTTRMLAYSIDAIVIFALEAGAVLLLMLSTPLLDRLQGLFRELASAATKGAVNPMEPNPAASIVLAFFLVLQFVVELGYFVAWELVSGGRSLGKLCLRLRVVQDDGRPVTLRASVIRNLLRMVDLLPGAYIVGLVAMVMSNEGKRLGDLAAGTIVVRLDRPEPVDPLLDAAPPPGLEQFRFDHAQLARIGSTERTLLRQTLRRIETLPPQTAAAVLEDVAGVLCTRIGHEPIDSTQQQAFLLALLYALRRR